MFNNFDYTYFVEACKGRSGWERVWGGWYRDDAIAKAREIETANGWPVEIVTKYGQHVEF